MRLRSRVQLIAVGTAVVLAACSGGSSATPPGGGATPTPGPSTAPTSTFATIVGPPTQFAGALQLVPVPAVPGTSAGGSMVVSVANPVTAVVTTASAAAAGTSGGPPLALQSVRRAKSFGGVTPTPQYYVGVTNTGGTAVAVNVSLLNLTVNVPAGQSPALAHYDPSLPQNGWNQDCAFGPGQVTQNGSNTTFKPGGQNGAVFTIYPGATLWFAPYTYPSSATSGPTPPPSSPTVVPTPAPAPSSLTGTYIGSALETAPQNNGSQYLEFALTQSGSSVGGTYALLPNANHTGAFGTIGGTVGGGGVTLNFSPQYGSYNCTGTLHGTASGGLISGTFSINTPSSCTGSGVFAVAVQTAPLPAISGNDNGTIDDTQNGQGTVAFSAIYPGTVYAGAATINWPNTPNASGPYALAGFVSNATTAYFAVLPPAGSGRGCDPNGTFTINGKTLSGNYSPSVGGTNGCAGSGSLTLTGQ